METIIGGFLIGLLGGVAWVEVKERCCHDGRCGEHHDEGGPDSEEGGEAELQEKPVRKDRTPARRGRKAPGTKRKA